ncbi:glycerophosphodiester phosphodiesterase [Actinomadura sp. HBU206391]|nr:glycerophosphodiester phosphodiesterase [Actinomadura sp. HBU206391]
MRDRVEAHGHRGSRGLRPENTLPSFAHALAIGVDVIELDVGLTADGVVIVNHDQALSPMIARDTAPSRPGDPMFPYVGRSVRDLTLAQIKTVDAGMRRPCDTDPFVLTQLPIVGTRMPTLTEVCDLIDRLGAHTPDLAVEIKTDPGWPDDEVARLVEAVAKIMDTCGLTRRTRILAFDWRVLAHARSLAPQAARRVALIEHETLEAGSAWLAGITPPEPGTETTTGPLDAAAWTGLLNGAISVGATMLSPERTLTGPELIGEAHRLGLPVTVWTVNEPVEMARLIDLGVDGIVTDYPDRLRAVMEARGLPLPPRHRARKPVSSL